MRLAHLAAEMGGSSALGKAIGHATGEQVTHMIAGRRAISDKTMDAVHALPGRGGWFYREGDAPTGENIDLIACLRYLRDELEALPAADRETATRALKHFVDNPDELLEVAETLQRLSEPER